jgi:dTDP-4-amino-4,6-dideoxygalactose transaminase
MINVTKTFLPPQEEYQAILKEAWDAGWITNRGVLVKRLEDQLKAYLKVPHIIAMTNGTLPLQIAIKALGLTGEIITTPFSYVATTSSIVWEGCTPVFVDIHPEFLTIDETRIEAAITSKTTAILATHVFGNPCAVEEIENIAKKHNLKVIYDAAHCFGVTYKGKSIFQFGDVSSCSFHATKLFQTGEGGALFTNNTELQNTLFYHHNFGHKGKEDFQGIGINAKMSELQAAMGLAVFPYLDQIIRARQLICEIYDDKLNFGKLFKIKIRNEVEWNYSYYPVFFESEEVLIKVAFELNRNEIFPRRYFYPSLAGLPYVQSNSCIIADSIAKRVLCLPLFHDLSISSLKEIIDTVNRNL